jgi:hypothetical protein
MGLSSAGHAAELDRYVGYYESYATTTMRSTATRTSRRRHATPRAPWSKREAAARGKFPQPRARRRAK